VGAPGAPPACRRCAIDRVADGRRAVIRVGEAALLLECASSAGVLAALGALQREPSDDVVDLVPGAETLLVVLTDPAAQGRPRFAAAEALARACAETAPGVASRPADGRDTGDARVHRIPVRYDGPDLEIVARRAGLTIAEVVERHQDGAYRVAFIGFQPGF